MEESNDRPTVCLFGGHDPTHSRVVNLRRALEDAGFPVVEVQTREGGPVGRQLRLVAGFLRRGRSADVLLVGAAGQRYVFLARLLTWLAGQRLVLDAFISHYLVIVEDVGEHPPDSLRGRALWLLDRWACRLADRVLLDTREHVDYFVKELGLDRERFRVIRLGADERIFHPPAEEEALDERTGSGGPVRKSERRVLYYGSFFPLQGAPLIARAARRFVGGGTKLVLAGDGPEKVDTMAVLEEAGVTEIEDHGWVEREEIGRLIRGADVCLGHFAETRQAHAVIPFKVYEVLACAGLLVMGRAQAVERVLEHGRDVWFCERGSPAAIAEAVESLLADAGLRERMVRKGRERYKAIGGREVLARQAAESLAGLVGRGE